MMKIFFHKFNNGCAQQMSKSLVIFILSLQKIKRTIHMNHLKCLSLFYIGKICFSMINDGSGDDSTIIFDDNN